MLGKTVRVPRHIELSEPGWKRTKPPLNVEFFAKACDSECGSLENGRYRAIEPGTLTITFPVCILLWAPMKMQLFLVKQHRKRLFSCGDAIGALLQGQ